MTHAGQPKWPVLMYTGPVVLLHLTDSAAKLSSVMQVRDAAGSGSQLLFEQRACIRGLGGIEARFHYIVCTPGSQATYLAW
ncbi:hypothetical protein C8Q72DRAFT_414670 [Fomitopsis betulina]|nr:hypothetical protein C8Q72DRAFT_414670 [Fomitopsis betulina]